jgi:hypothetical protein
MPSQAASPAWSQIRWKRRLPPWNSQRRARKITPGREAVVDGDLGLTYDAFSSAQIDGLLRCRGSA